MTYAYLLLVLAAFYLLLIVEFLVPSGGMLGAAALAMLVAAIVIAFSNGVGTGIAVVILLGVTTPLLLYGLVRSWPHTPIGRQMLNRRPGEISQIPRRTTVRGTPIDELVGRTGLVKRDLLPSGMVLIDGEKLEATSAGMPIDAGSTVIVTHVELGRLYVRICSAQDRQPTVESAPLSPPSLEESLESFDVDSAERT